MKLKDYKNYADDEDTNTLQVISGVTSEGCIVSEREYEYEDEDENSRTFGETLTGIELILESVTVEDQVLRTLEELAEEISAADLTLVED